MRKQVRQKWLGAAAALIVGAGVLAWVYRSDLFPVRIGFSATLTGMSSELGVNGRNGALLAVEEVNQAGGLLGRKVELVVLDDKNDPEVARAVDEQFYRQGIEVVIGHMVSGMAQTTVAFANEKKMLLVSPTISTEALTRQDDYFVRVVPANSVQGNGLAITVLRHATARNVAIVYDQRNELFAQPIITTFDNVFTGVGGRIATIEPFASQADFPRVLQNLKQTNADGVLVIASALDAAMFCQLSKINHLQLPLFLSMWSMTNDFIKAGGRAVEGTQLISQIDLVSETREYQQFRQKYQARYGEEPTFPAVLSYNAALVAFSGIQSAKSTSGEKVKAAIVEKRQFPGLHGVQVLAQSGDTPTKYFLYREQNGAYKKEGTQ